MSDSTRSGLTLSSVLRVVKTSPLIWDLFLTAVTVAWSLYFLHQFFPGRMNVDIANQYLQATGKIPVSDWHPPIMSAVWRVLMDLTGQPGILFVLQVGLVAAACLLLGILTHRLGVPRWVSLLGPGLMMTPWVLSQLTTLWKDTQMAAAMLLAVILLLVVRLKPGWWVLLLPALGLLVYALGLRKNALFALFPIAVYLAYCFVRFVMSRRGTVPSRSRLVLSVSAVTVIIGLIIGGGVKATDAVIASRVTVNQTGQISQIFLDDVMFSVPQKELMATDAPIELKKHINQARNKCLKKGEIWDSYWNCYGRGEAGTDFSPIAYQDELRELWMTEVITSPVRYLDYRLSVFSNYFFASSLEYWPGEWNGKAKAADFPSGNPRADYIFEPYVKNFALGTFPMLFKPWFWSLLAVLLLGLWWHSRRGGRSSVHSVDGASVGGSHLGHFDDGVRRRRNLWPEIVMLSTASLFYILGYLPTAPANHFRYTYWPAIAVSVALVLWIVMVKGDSRSGDIRSGDTGRHIQDARKPDGYTRNQS